MHKVKNYHFLGSSRVICLDDSMIDAKDISAIYVKDVVDGIYVVQIMLKSKGYINFGLSVGIKDALQADFLRERERRIQAAEYNHKMALEKQESKKKAPKKWYSNFNIWWKS